MLQLCKDTFREFWNDECPRLAASLAYYALFSLPALLITIVSAAGMFTDRQAVVDRVHYYMQQIMGDRGADQVGTILAEGSNPGQGMASWLISLVLLLIGASGVLAEVQTALNRAWGVKVDPDESYRRMLIKRVISLGVVLGIALLLLASLVISWLLSEFAAVAYERAPGWISPALVRALDQLVSLGIVTLLFAGTFKFLPDVRLDWTDVGIGAFITALLFVLGKFLLGLYLAWSDPTSAYGAAGSLALVLVWIYYSAMIYFLGAEFTQVYAKSRGRRVKLEEGATHDTETTDPKATAGMPIAKAEE